MLRIICFFVVTAMIFLFPWWVGAIVAIVCAFYFTTYAEIVFFGILIDALYGYGVSLDRFQFTIVALLILFITPIVKSKLYVRS
jgi:hypothetical protein